MREQYIPTHKEVSVGHIYLDDVETELDHVFVTRAVIPGSGVHLERITEQRVGKTPVINARLTKNGELAVM